MKMEQNAATKTPPTLWFSEFLGLKDVVFHEAL